MTAVLAALVLVVLVAETWLTLRQLRCQPRQAMARVGLAALMAEGLVVLLAGPGGGLRAVTTRLDLAPPLQTVAMVAAVVVALWVVTLPARLWLLPTSARQEASRLGRRLLPWCAAALLADGLAVSLGQAWPHAWPLAALGATALAAYRLLRPASQSGPVAPLADPAVGDVVQRLARRLGLDVTLWQSAGAGPANAGIRGFGRTARIVFHCRLLDRLSRAEVVAVTAHELAHRLLRHHERYLLLQAALAMSAAAGLAALTAWPAIWPGLGLPLTRPGAVVAVAALWAPVASWLVQPLLCLMRRHYEFEADAVARRLCGHHFAQALRRLQGEPAAGDALYQAVHQPYPPLHLRLERLILAKT